MFAARQQRAKHAPARFEDGGLDLADISHQPTLGVGRYRHVWRTTGRNDDLDRRTHRRTGQQSQP